MLSNKWRKNGPDQYTKCMLQMHLYCDLQKIKSP